MDNEEFVQTLEMIQEKPQLLHEIDERRFAYLPDEQYQILLAVHAVAQVGGIEKIRKKFPANFKRPDAIGKQRKGRKKTPRAELNKFNKMRYVFNRIIYKGQSQKQACKLEIIQPKVYRTTLKAWLHKTGIMTYERYQEIADMCRK